jgi:hypothetical protein
VRDNDFYYCTVCRSYGQRAAGVLKNIEVPRFANDVATGGTISTDSWGLDRVDQTIGGFGQSGRSYTYLRDGSNVDVYIIDSGDVYRCGDFGGRASFGPDYGREIKDDNAQNTCGRYVSSTLPYMPSFVVRLGLKITTSPTFLMLVFLLLLFRFRNCWELLGMDRQESQFDFSQGLNAQNWNYC